MGVKICPNCGGKVAESRSDCIHCGYVFPAVIKCPDCEAELPVDTKVCPDCGHVFPVVEEVPSEKPVAQEQPQEEVPTQEEQPVEEVEGEEDAVICPFCGSKQAMQIGANFFMCEACHIKFGASSGNVTYTPSEQVVPSYVPTQQNQGVAQQSNNQESSNKETVNEEVPPINGRGLAIALASLSVFLVLASFILLIVSPLGVKADHSFCIDNDDYIYLFRPNYTSTTMSFVFALLALFTSVVSIILLFKSKSKGKPTGCLITNVVTVVLAIASSISIYFLRNEDLAANVPATDYDSTISGPMIPLFFLMVGVLTIPLVSYLIKKSKDQPYVTTKGEIADVSLHSFISCFAVATLSLTAFSVVGYISKTNVFLWTIFPGEELVSTSFVFILFCLLFSVASLVCFISKSKVAKILALSFDILCALFALLYAITFLKLGNVTIVEFNTSSGMNETYDFRYSTAGYIDIPFAFVTFGFSILAAIIKAFSIFKKPKEEQVKKAQE